MAQATYPEHVQALINGRNVSLVVKANGTVAPRAEFHIFWKPPTEGRKAGALVCALSVECALC